MSENTSGSGDRSYMYRQNFATYLGRVPVVVPPCSLRCIPSPDSPDAPQSPVPQQSLMPGATLALDPFAILVEQFARCLHVTYDDSKKKKKRTGNEERGN